MKSDRVGGHVAAGVVADQQHRAVLGDVAQVAHLAAEPEAREQPGERQVLADVVGVAVVEVGGQARPEAPSHARGEPAGGSAPARPRRRRRERSRPGPGRSQRAGRSARCRLRVLGAPRLVSRRRRSYRHVLSDTRGGRQRGVRRSARGDGERLACVAAAGRPRPAPRCARRSARWCARAARPGGRGRTRGGPPGARPAAPRRRGARMRPGRAGRCRPRRTAPAARGPRAASRSLARRTAASR